MMRLDPVPPRTSALLVAALTPVLAAALFLASRFRIDCQGRRVIHGLILANLAFVLLYLLHHATPGGLVPDILLLDRDRSLPEYLNYGQTLACAALLLALYADGREEIYLGWAAVFTFVAADDALSVHEQGARLLSAWIDLPAVAGLRPQDTGELMVWSAFAVPLLVMLIVAFRRSSREAAGFGGVFALLFAALVFFAVAFDMLHSALSGLSYRSERLLALVEDGGEMLTLALACAAALLLHRGRRSLRAPGPDTGLISLLRE